MTEPIETTAGAGAVEDEACWLVEVDGEPVRVHGAGEMDDTDRGYLAEVVRAAKAKFAAEHADSSRPVVSPSRDGGPVDDELVKRLRVAARVAFPGPDDTDASYLLGAARKLESGYEAGGSNVKAAIARVLRVVAEVVRDV